jgi:hypothetical protein
MRVHVMNNDDGRELVETLPLPPLPPPRTLCRGAVVGLPPRFPLPREVVEAGAEPRV